MGHRPVTIDDLFRLELPFEPVISPDGATVCFGLQRTDLKLNRYCSNLWLVDADGERPRPLTRGDHSDHAARWSPDGSLIAFVSDRGETAQIWTIPVDGGEASPLTDLPEGSLDDLAWSPDGSRLAFTFRARPEWMRKAAVEERTKDHRSTPPVRITRLRYREEGSGYFHDEYRHVYIVDLTTRESVAVTRGSYDHSDVAWSPEGTRLAFVTNRSEDPARTPWLRDIHLLDLESEELASQPLAAPAGPKHHLAWSPDGSRIAYYGHTDTRDAWSETQPLLWTVEPGSGQALALTAGLDRPVGDCTLGDVKAHGGGWGGPVWLPDSQAILFLVSDRGASHLYRVHAWPDAEPVNLTPGLEAEIAAISLDEAGSRLAALVIDPARPGEVAILDPETPQPYPHVITAHNGELLDEVRLAVPQEVSASGEAGEVHGWLLRPAEADGPIPILLYIHGGPHTQYGWCFMHELQLHAARGYAVLFANPRGSHGYGQAHVGAIRGDWGGPDYRDLMAILDHACTLPGIDASRQAITGGSYGGYMTNWALGHTRRFLCGITQRSVVNLHSMGGTCDFCFNNTAYFGGNAWEAPEALLRQSPLSYVHEIDTPLLIIHSEGDLRCPIEQAEQLYAALRNQGKCVEFLRFPQEANHGLSRGGPPDLRRARLEAIVEWLARWVGGA